MRRREFITLLGGGAVAWAALASEASGQRGDSNVRATSAQQGAKPPRIGIVVPGHSVGPDASRVTLDALVTGLRDLGYTEGQNITIERGFAESNADRVREIAVELVQRQVDARRREGRENRNSGIAATRSVKRSPVARHIFGAVLQRDVGSAAGLQFSERASFPVYGRRRKRTS